MMKSTQNKSSGLIQGALSAVLGLALLAVLLPSTALATTAANTVINNTVTVNYDDTGGTPQVPLTASVAVTVNLVTAHSTLSAPLDAQTPSNVALDYTYTITNNSNGPDTYNLTESSVLGANVNSETHVFRDAADTGDIISIYLGATSVAVAATTGDTVITVPSDGVSDASVNGIIVGDTVVIGSVTTTVTAVTDNATGTSTITLLAGIGENLIVGTQIGEQGTFISRTTPIATVNLSTYVITVTADDGVTAGPAPTDDTTTTVLVSTLTVVKYVANVTTPVVGGGTTIALNTGLGAGNITYYTSGVTGIPTDNLEYVIAIVNAAGGATATDVVISDPVPAYTSQTGNIALDPGTAVFSNVASTADNGDFAEVVANTVFIYAGDGSVAGEGDDSTNTGGQLAPNTTTYGAFRVTIQ